MEIQELPQIVTAHQQAIARHDQYEGRMDRIEATLERTQNILNANAEQLVTLTAGLLELRNLVADYMSEGRL
ncbi:hypothetical protein K9N68_04745 [Kovacikia minuta CCNUW1]|uniref:hypothetical protein n=1 Tax=Kovacikia minuta TaxID=2931930 RepID=UPI001CCE99F0|nr:hypothetical protein [Kovacikia minuta]UBF27275.1 hypothetical protein K9N68_04745 [Kovacikia minuta CCNUW1]